MKKQAKLMVIVLVIVMALSVVAFTACGNKQTQVAYGLVHREGYVGIATVEVVSGVLVSAKLDEACFPTQVKATANDGADYTVAVTSGETTTYYWKTVKYGNVTMVYDADGGYKVGTQTIKEYFNASEENCKAYAEAVQNNKVTVVTANGDKTDIMTAAKLLKTQNGYWSGAGIKEGQLGWKKNAEATCAYVVEYGFDGVTAKEDLTQPGKNDDNVTGDMKDEYVDKNDVKTGATWTDMWDYVNLLHNAFNKASAK